MVGRPRKIDTPQQRIVRLPASVSARLDALLWSDVEGRVPYGAFQTLITRLVEDWLVKQVQQSEKRE